LYIGAPTTITSASVSSAIRRSESASASRSESVCGSAPRIRKVRDRLGADVAADDLRPRLARLQRLCENVGEAAGNGFGAGGGAVDNEKLGHDALLELAREDLGA
jgi:hypothetical protein